MADALFELFPVELTFKRALDIGSATGRVASRLSGRLPGASVIALDLSIPMLLKAKERSQGGERQGAGSFSLVSGDLEELPFLDDSIELVMSNITYQWAENFSSAIGELYRVLAPGGVVLMNTLVYGTLDELKVSVRGAEEMLAKETKRSLMHYLKPGAVKKSVERAGLKLSLFEERTSICEYNDMWELLRVLKNIGAASPLPANDTSLGAGSLLKSAAQIYKSRFSLKPKEGETIERVRATYNTVFLMASKPACLER